MMKMSGMNAVLSMDVRKEKDHIIYCFMHFRFLLLLLKWNGITIA